MNMQFGDATPEPADEYRDEQGNRTVRCKRSGVTYRGFTIVEKRDFGAQAAITQGGFKTTHGFVVTDGGIVNVMPGAAWFETVPDALRAIDDLIAAHVIPYGAGEHPFWALNRLRRYSEEHAPELALLLQELVTLVNNNFDDIAANGAIPPALAEAKALLDQIDDNCDMRSTTRHVAGHVTRNGLRIKGRFGLGAA